MGLLIIDIGPGTGGGNILGKWKQRNLHEKEMDEMAAKASKATKKAPSKPKQK